MISLAKMEFGVAEQMQREVFFSPFFSRREERGVKYKESEVREERGLNIKKGN